jgi:hypothetical protein
MDPIFIRCSLIVSISRMQDNHSIQSSISIEIVVRPIDPTILQGIECFNKTAHKVVVDTIGRLSTKLFVSSCVHPGRCHKGIYFQVSIGIGFEIGVYGSSRSDIWILAWIVKERVDVGRIGKDATGMVG